MDSFDKLGTAADSSYEDIIDGAQEASEAVERAAESTDYWTDAIGNYDKGAMEAVYTTEELVDMGFKTEDALEAAADSADEAAEKIGEYGDESEEAGKKSEEFGDKSTDAIVSLDDVLAAAGIAIAIKAIYDGFSEASAAASEFTTSIAKLTTVADTSVLSADQLSEQISSMSQNMAQNVNDLADSAYNAISAGVDTADAVSTVGQATELAVAGFTSTESSLSVLTTALNAYKLEATELTNISDSLVTSQNLGVMTIDQLSSSIGKAISTASAYSVDLYNLESGYISLTKSGISVEESTTYISGMFNELGDAGSDVSKVLQEETGQTFGQLMIQGYTLADALEIVYDSVNQDSEALMNLWGSAEAGKAANAIINQGLDTFNTNLEKLQNSSGATAMAYETMTGTTEFATQRMANSFENLKIAVGDDLNPVIADFQNGIADITDGMTGIIEEHPAITAVITGATIGMGVLVVGVTGYVAVTKIATVVTATLGTTITASLGPIALLIAAVSAVAAGVIYMANAEDEAAIAQEALTSSSMEMKDELDELQEQYDALADAGEADTVAAYELKNQIDELTESFESNKQSIGDLLDYNEQLKTTLDEIGTSYDETMDSVNQSESDAKSLIAQLVSMSESTELSSGQLEIMQGIVDRLNGSYEGLNLTLDETNGKLNMSVEELWNTVTEAANQEKAQANMDALMDYLGQYQEAQKTFDESNKTMNDAWAEYETAVDENFGKEHPFLDWTGWADGAEMNWSGTAKEAFNVYEQAKTATDGAKENFEALDESIRACYESMGYSADEIDDMMAELALASASSSEFTESLEDMQETEEELISTDEAVSDAISGVSDRLQEMGENYDAAYEAAQESVSGQYSLWQSVDEVVAMTSSDITDALQSQIDYWNAYNTNLDTLTEKSSSIEGLSDALAAVADGSEDSAAMLAGMAEMSDEDLAAMVEQYTNLQSEQDNTATSMADLQTDFSASLDAMQKDMEDAVTAMNMADDAEAAAKATLDGYIAGIKSKTVEVNSALSAISFTNSNTPGLTGYATGTESAEPGLKLVGEEGPEIIDFEGGERVYNAAETSDIMSGEGRGSDFYVAPEESGDGESGSGDKTITLKIEGSGDMRIGSNMSKDDVVNVLMENMKDALMNIIHQEILEEGDLSYEF
ncbi:MAG: phage tail tape measure protein [Hespellia sp.]|nr:phage tail tape measure protein [Hespellia sp.]